jgi:hypothetical protein
LAHFSTSIETHASPAMAFDYLADFSNASLWDPTVSRAARLTPRPIGVGSRFEILLGWGAIETRLEYHIRRFEPGRCVVFEAETKFLRSLDTIEIDSKGDGCRVHYDADLRPRGAVYLLDLLIQLAFQITGKRSVKGLERGLERLASGTRQ